MLLKQIIHRTLLLAQQIGVSKHLDYVFSPFYQTCLFPLALLIVKGVIICGINTNLEQL